MFYEINKTLNFANKSYRKILEELENKIGKAKLTNAVLYACKLATSDDKYAPVITNPVELKEKFAKLQIHFNKNKEKQIQERIL